MVRCGIAIYGLDPFQADPFERGLEPALELRSYVADTKRFPAGASAGYGRRWRAPADTWVGVLPIGYGDGVRRGLTNNGEALVGGSAVPVRRHRLDGQRDRSTWAPTSSVEPGSPAVLIGAQGDDRILCEEVARRLGDDQLRGHLRDLRSRVPRVQVRSGGRVSAAIPELLAAAPAVRACREALGDETEAWIVGGAIRDAALGREVTDVDLAVAGDERQAAREIGRAAGGPVFQLSEEFASWRALAARRRLARGRRPGCEATESRPTSRLRDFTVNAIAVPLADPAAPPLDPHGGLADLEARVLRAVSDAQLRRRPAADPAGGADRRRPGARGRSRTPSRSPARRRGGPAEPAGERQFAELRLLLTGADPIRGLRLLDELGATRGRAARARGASRRRAEPVPPPRRPRAHDGGAGAADRGGGRPRGLRGRPAARRSASCSPSRSPTSSPGAARCASRRSFHDLGKPETRAVGEGGRVLFIGHDRAGARLVRELCSRLRTSRRLADYLANLTLNHLRLGFLVHERPLSRRHVYDYLRATDPDSVDVTLLTVADRLATQGERTRQEAVDAHLELAREMIAEALAWRRAGPPRSPIRGDELASELGIEPGPRARPPARRDRGGGVRGRGLDARGGGRPGATDPLGLPVLGCRADGRATASSAGSSPARCRRRSSTPTSTRSPSWTSTRPRGGMRWWCRAPTAPTCSRSPTRTWSGRCSPLAAWRRKIRAALEPDGFNVLNSCGPAAWQTIFHFHLHVIPRYDDDPLKLPWIPRGGEAEEIAAVARSDQGGEPVSAPRFAWSATAPSPRWSSTTRR